jgi:hypothetical protein
LQADTKKSSKIYISIFIYIYLSPILELSLVWRLQAAVMSADGRPVVILKQRLRQTVQAAATAPATEVRTAHATEVAVDKATVRVELVKLSAGPGSAPAPSGRSNRSRVTRRPDGARHLPEDVTCFNN